MRSPSASIDFLSFEQGGAAASWLGPMPPGYRTRRGDIPLAQSIEQRLRCRPVKILVEIVVDLQDRRVGAGAQTLDFDQSKHTVRRRAPNADTELLFAGVDHLVRAAQPARRRRAGLQQVASDRPQ